MNAQPGPDSSKVRPTRRAVLIGFVAWGCLAAGAGLALGPGRHASVGSEAGFDAVRDLEHATVRRGTDRPCQRRDGGKHVCGAEDWAFVGPYVARLGGEVRRCIWLHPAPRGVQTEIRYVPGPIGARLRGRLGLIEGAGPGEKLEVTVHIGTQEVLRTSVSDDVAAVDIDVPIPPGPPEAEVVLRAHARRHDWRMGCLALTMEGARVAGPEPSGPGPRRRRGGR